MGKFPIQIEWILLHELGTWDYKISQFHQLNNIFDCELLLSGKI